MDFASGFLVGMIVSHTYNNMRRLNESYDSSRYTSSRYDSMGFPTYHDGASYGLNKHLVRYEVMKNQNVAEAVNRLQESVKNKLLAFVDKADIVLVKNKNEAKEVYAKCLALQNQIKEMGFGLSCHKKVYIKTQENELGDGYNLFDRIELNELTKELVSKSDFYVTIANGSLATYKRMYELGDGYFDIDRKLSEVQRKIAKMERNKIALKLSANFRDELDNLKLSEKRIISDKNEIARETRQIEVFKNMTEEQKQIFVEYVECLDKLKSLEEENNTIIQQKKWAEYCEDKSYGMYGDKYTFYDEFLTQSVKEIENTEDGNLIASFSSQFTDFYINNQEKIKDLGITEKTNFTICEDLVYDGLLTDTIKTMVESRLNELKSTEENENQSSASTSLNAVEDDEEEY